MKFALQAQRTLLGFFFQIMYLWISKVGLVHFFKRWFNSEKIKLTQSYNVRSGTRKTLRSLKIDSPSSELTLSLPSRYSLSLTATVHLPSIMTSNRSQHLLIRTALGLNFCTAGTDEDTDPTARVASSSIVSSATTSMGIVGDIRRAISGLFRLFPEGLGGGDEDDRKVLLRRRGCNILVSFLSSCLRGEKPCWDQALLGSTLIHTAEKICHRE